MLQRFPAKVLIAVGIAAFFPIGFARGWENKNCGFDASFALGYARVAMSYCIGIAIWRINGVRPIGPAWLALVLMPLAVLVSYLEWGDYLVVLLVNPLLLLLGLGFNDESRSAPLASFLGAASFPIYALHWPIHNIALQAGYFRPAAFVGGVTASIFIGVSLNGRLRRALNLTRLLQWRTSAS